MHDLVLRPQRILSLCSGAGGLDLGVHDALGGCAQSICYVEHETTAAEVLAARIEDGALDDAPIWTDLHAFDARGWRGRVDGIIGGYPCQPFSVAGKRLGTADPRHLWPSISRIIAECEPAWCFFENVGGHLRLGYWDVVRPDLERLGYRVAEGLFTAAEVGASHQRERLFILAHRSGATGGVAEPVGIGRAPAGPGGDGAELAHAAIGGQRERGEPSERDGQPHGGCEHRYVDRTSDGAFRCDECGDPVDDAERERGRGGDSGREDAADADASGEGVADPGIRQLSEPWRGAEGRDGVGSTGTDVLGDRLPLFPPGPGDTDAWQRILAERPDLAPAVEPSVRGVADGLETRVDLSRTAQLRITGNGVVPQCASFAFRTLWRQLGGGS